MRHFLNLDGVFALFSGSTVESGWFCVLSGFFLRMSNVTAKQKWFLCVNWWSSREWCALSGNNLQCCIFFASIWKPSWTLLTHCTHWLLSRVNQQMRMVLQGAISRDNWYFWQVDHWHVQEIGPILNFVVETATQANVVQRHLPLRCFCARIALRKCHLAQKCREWVPIQRALLPLACIPPYTESNSKGLLPPICKESPKPSICVKEGFWLQLDAMNMDSSLTIAALMEGLYMRMLRTNSNLSWQR